MEKLLSYLKNIHPLNEETRNRLQEGFKRMILPKGEYLIREGNTCRYLYFLEQGCLRGFYNHEGREVAHWFGFENDFVTSFHSFITQEPAVESIQLLEGCVLWAISKSALNGLMDTYHPVERLVRMAYEQYYIRLEERYVNAQFKTASELYDNLMKRTPHIVERIPLGLVASYLGISQETLSRVRSRL